MKKPLQFSPASALAKSIAIVMLLLFSGTGLRAQIINSFPFTETFNSNSPTLQYWTQVYEINNMSWTFTDDASTGSYDLDPYDGNFANYPATSHEFDTTKLVSPLLNLAGMSNVTLNFVYVNPFWSPDQNWLTIYYRISATDPWVQLQEYHSNITTWTPSGNITLPNPTATYQIAIECKTDYGYSTLVDQVVINGTPGAVTVASVDVATQGGVPAEITTAGGTLPLVATVNPAGANQSVTWSVVSGPATVSASGVVTATGNGTVTVRATSVEDPTKFDDIVITVNAAVAVTDVVITTQGNVPAEITTAGGTLPLVATVNPAGANQAVTWSVVAGSNFGSVSATGVVTATANGILTVQATSVADPTKFDILDIVVNVPVAVVSVDVATQGGVPATITTEGGTLPLTATVNPAGANQAVIWSVVSGPATVSASGVVTATSNGTVTIRATSVSDPTKFDEIVITIAIVIPVTDVVISTQGNVPAEITTQGGTLQLVATVNPSGASQEVTWSVVAGSAFASVSATGVVTATANGIVTIQAASVADPTKTDIIDVLIDFIIPAESVDVTTEGGVPAAITTEGGTLQLEAVVNPSGADQEVVWTIVSGSDFATLGPDGLVTATGDGTVVVRATSVSDPTIFDEITITITGNLGTGSFAISNLNAYPNPVTDMLNISGGDIIKSVEVHNMLGQLVLSKTINSDKGQIDMGTFPAGNYIVKIGTDKGFKKVKVIKR
ncbi:Ig-like domain-containing protein [Flavobacterium sp. MFBS3-15]|uniref:Ig-like domain-containing protein n=1 Tax=Flavobacterium sp. MFBS3-15 TaxID=2989816 RepID=UPI002235DC9D|nr:Ig-like domain-containing protein [Flavobacterium sp. MFBS3-15]MCW4469771.1 Ig-like domain-containing protein [Flavobacterium sp. MFBS3-15]